MISAVRRVVKLAQDLWILWHRHSCQALLPVLSGKNKYYCARLSARPARCPLTPTIIFERARGSRGPQTAPFLRGLGWGSRGSPERAVFCAGWGGIEMPSPANEPLRSLDFVAQAPLACAVGTRQASCARLSAVQQMSSHPTIIFERARGSRSRACEGRRAKGESKR
jgi:hypothetical protein